MKFTKTFTHKGEKVMKFTKTLAVLTLCVSGQAMAQDEVKFDVSPGNMFVPRSLAESSTLSYENGAYRLVLDGQQHQIASRDAKGVPGVPARNLEETIRCGYFKVLGDATDPRLEWQGRVVGGIQTFVREYCDKGRPLGESLIKAGAWGTLGATVGGFTGGVPGAIWGFISS